MKRSWRKTSAAKAVECAGSSWINISLHLWLQVASLWQSDMSFQTPSVKPKEKWSYVLHINTQKCQRIHSPAWKQKCRGKTLGIKPWKCKGLLWRSGFIQHHTWGRHTLWWFPLLLVPFSSWWVSQTQSHNEHHALLSATPAPISEIEHCLAGGCKATHLSAIDHIRNITSEFQKINISARRFFYVWEWSCLDAVECK